jgi:hypothetical protein
MPLQVDKEKIVPRFKAGRPGLNLGKVNPVLLKRTKHRIEGPDPVTYRKHNGGAVPASRPAGGGPDNQESRDIAPDILNMAIYNF